MRRNWKILLGIFLILAAVTAERLSARYVGTLARKRKAVDMELEAARTRTSGVTEEQSRYRSALAVAAKLQECVKWEPDSTNILRWFAETAGDVGVRITNSRMLPTEKRKETVARGTFTRTRYAVLVEGGYGSLVRYVERVEHSPHAMVVDSFALQADREARSRGQLKMTVSCLCPVPKATPAPGKAGETHEQR